MSRRNREPEKKEDQGRCLHDGTSWIKCANRRPSTTDRPTWRAGRWDERNHIIVSFHREVRRDSLRECCENQEGFERRSSFDTTVDARRCRRKLPVMWDIKDTP
jgi:hypothetical protein